MKKTIIYIGGFRLPDKNAAAHRVIANALLLRELGYETVFIDVDDDCGKDIIKTKRQIYDFDCYSVEHPESTLAWLGYLTDISAVKLIERKYQNVSAVIVYNYPAMAMARLMRWCQRKGCKLISDCTEWYQKSNNPVKNIDSDMRMKKLQQKLDGVICISRFLEEYYRSSTNTTYLPPLVDPTDNKWRQNINKEDVLTFTYAGTPGKHKDKLDMIIKSLYELNPDRRYKYNIMGITKEQFLSYYPELSKTLVELDDRVAFLGRVQHKEVLAYTQGSDFSVFFRPDTLTTRAGFPTKYVEAVTCGTPVITNKTSDLSDYIRDGENAILIDGYEKKDIKAAFERVFAMPREQIAAIKAECEAERDRFDYRKYKDRMNRFIDEVLNKK